MKFTGEITREKTQRNASTRERKREREREGERHAMVVARAELVGTRGIDHVRSMHTDSRGERCGRFYSIRSRCRALARAPRLLLPL